VVIVDDHLTLLALAGVMPVTELGDDIATTSLWYLRLVSAATAPPAKVHGPVVSVAFCNPSPSQPARSNESFTRLGPHSRYQ